MNKAVRTFRLGRLFFGIDFARRGTRWVTYSGRKRREHIFSLGRVYDRESRLYVWSLFLFSLSIAVGVLRGKKTLNKERLQRIADIASKEEALMVSASNPYDKMRK